MLREQNDLVVKRFAGESEVYTIAAGQGEVADWYPVPHTATDSMAQDV